MNADDSVNGQNVNINKFHEPIKENIWKRPAIYVAILALIVAIWAEREARLTEYYAVDLEIWARDHGMKPPADPWGKYVAPNGERK